MFNRGGIHHGQSLPSVARREVPAVMLKMRRSGMATRITQEGPRYTNAELFYYSWVSLALKSDLAYFGSEVTFTLKSLSG